VVGGCCRNEALHPECHQYCTSLSGRADKHIVGDHIPSRPNKYTHDAMVSGTRRVISNLMLNNKQNHPKKRLTGTQSRGGYAGQESQRKLHHRRPN
jgi:hypothetical protein